MRCAEIAEQVPAMGDDREIALAVRRHLSRCPGCRAELARYSSLKAALAGLAETTVEPPADLLPALYAIPTAGSRTDVVRTHLARNRRAYASGAAALAGAAVAAAVYRRRRLATT